VANRSRQAEEARVVDEARALCAPEGSALPPILVGWSEAWHPGVVGIAAGRLAREFRRPTVLLAVRDGVATGSGRSVPQVHLHDFLLAWSDSLTRFGGHAQAIGLSVAAERLPELRDAWASAATWGDTLGLPAREYELTCAAGEIDEALLTALERMAPYGQGNPQPLARVGPLQVRSLPRLFGDGHLAAIATGDGGARVEILGWGWAGHSEMLRRPFELLAHIERDRRHRGVVLRGVDLRALPA
jgi:single-stranded-DNA-specific exonuclease